MTHSLDLALAYAELGWQVFPVHTVVNGVDCSCGRSDCDRDKGKHPVTRNGFHDGTDDADEIASWWKQDWNVGIATGDSSGIWVLDLDVDSEKSKNGVAIFEAEMGRNGFGWESLECAIQETGGGGLQLFFLWDSDLPIPSTSDKIERGVDTRGDGGYVIVPPSHHKSGGEYRWRVDPFREIGHAPSWVYEWVLSRVSRAGDGGRKTASVVVGDLPLREIISLRSALSAIDPNCDYDTWFRVGMALESTGAGEQAFQLWDEWSANATRNQGEKPKHAVYPGTEALRTKWRSFGRRQGEEVRVASIYHYALEAGWQGQVDELPDGTVHVMTPQQVRRPRLSEPAAPAGVELAAPVIPWPDPEPFDSASRKLPEFPLYEAFPGRADWMRDWVTDIASVFQVPVEFPASLAIAMLSGAILGKWRVQRTDAEWSEEPPLWVVVAGPSGIGKSQVFKPLVEPFRDHERELDEVAAFAEHTGNIALAEAALKKAKGEVEKKMGVVDPKDPEFLKLTGRVTMAQANFDRLLENPPQSDRILMPEATSEAMVAFLQGHHGRALVADPEGSVFDHALGRHSSGGGRRLDAWLKAYSAEDHGEIRIGNGYAGAMNPSRSRMVRSPRISIALCTQTGVLGDLFGDKGAGEKGFLARFLPVVIEPKAPEGFVITRRLAEYPKERWSHEVRRLLGRPFPEHPANVGLSPEATKLFDDWGNARIASLTTADALAEYFEAWNSKLRGKVLRIALALHCVGRDVPGSIEIDEETMRCAIAWSEYFEAQNQALSSRVFKSATEHVANRLLGWAERNGIERFTRTEAYQGLKARADGSTVRKIDDLNPSLELLAEANWIRAVGPLKRRRDGVSVASAYTVHPTVIAQ